MAVEKRRFQCQQCNKIFSHQSALSRHWLNFHGRDSHVATCDICGMVFKNVRCLREHLLTKHQTKRLVRFRRYFEYFRCKFCGKEYSERRHFSSHLSTMHPNEDQSVDESRIKTTNNKPD
jgi:transcription elongation factor Elf1